jgi:hypothetical protein
VPVPTQSGELAPGAFPSHERGRRQLFDAHLKNGRKLKETENRHAADLVLANCF